MRNGDGGTGERRTGSGRVTAREANVAVRAEPSSVGTARARDRLALEIRLLGSLLGQVIAEQAGVELLDLVERVRRTTIRLRREDDAAERRGSSPSCWPASTSTGPRSSIRAFSLYFRLVNLAEEREQVRTVRRRRARADERRDATRRRSAGDRGARPVGGCATATTRRELVSPPPDHAGPHGPPDRGPPADRADRAPPRRAPARPPRRPRHPDAGRGPRRRGAACARRSRSCGGRPTSGRRAVSPLDEVRTALAFFDETLFSVVPRVYRGGRRRARRRRGPRPSTRREPPLRDGPRRPTPAGPGRGRRWCRPFLRWELVDRRRPRRQPVGHRRGHRADAADPRRPRPARLRGGRDPAVADDRGRDARPSESPRALATRLARDAELLPGPRPPAPAGASRTSRIASGSGSSPSGSAGRGPT